jgi:hypothetical protein
MGHRKEEKAACRYISHKISAPRSAQVELLLPLGHGGCARVMSYSEVVPRLPQRNPHSFSVPSEGCLVSRYDRYISRSQTATDRASNRTQLPILKQVDATSFRQMEDCDARDQE